MSLRLSGINPLAYTGVEPLSPPQFEIHDRAPTVNDYISFNVGTIWLHKVAGVTPTNESLYVLVSKDAQVATWVSLGGGDLETLTGNSGGAVSPDASDNINVVGDAVGITIAGNPGTNTLTASLVGGGVAAQSFPTGAGVSTTSGTTAVPTAAGVLNILGAHNVLTGGAVANTVTVFGTNTITVGDLAVVTSGNNAITVTSGNVTLSGTGGSAAGNINIPNTTSDGRQGVITLGSNRFISNFGPLFTGATADTYVGSNSGNFDGGQGGNTGCGSETLQNVTGVGCCNTAVGAIACKAITTGRSNTGIGSSSLLLLTTGDNNTAVGYSSLPTITTGSSNTAIGDGSILNAAGASSDNTAVGADSLANIASGNNNTALGSLAASALTTNDSNNIFIGYNAVGAAGTNNTLQIGNGTGAGASQLNRAFISGIRGITTGVNDAVAVLVDSANQLGTVSSSLRYKENVVDMGHESDGLLELRPVVFNYKEDATKSKQYGLIAEEVEQVLPRLVVYKDGLPETIKYHELPVLLLNELKKQQKMLEEQAEIIDNLSRKAALLEKLMNIQ